MDGDSTHAFLGGMPITVEPTAIERTLSQLWKPATDEALTPDDGEPGVTRLSLGTVVVVAEARAAAAAEALCREIALSHPSRIVAVLVSDEDVLTASVFATCHLPAPGRPQVCSETIVLRVARNHLDHLPGLVLPLLLPDVLATLVWLASAPPMPELARELAAVMDRAVLDLAAQPDPGAHWRALDPVVGEQTTDLAWWRSAAWREGIAQSFDGAGDPAVLAAVDALAVAGGGDSPVPAALQAGWLAGQLRWTPEERLAEGESRWRRPDGSAGTVRLTHGDGPGELNSLALSASSIGGGWQAERPATRPNVVRLAAHCRDWCQMPFTVPLAEESPARALLASLASPPSNRIRIRALRHAAWLLGWS